MAAPVLTIRDTEKKGTTVERKVLNEFIQSLSASVMKTLAVQCACPASAGTPLDVPLADIPTADIAAIIGITAKGLGGNVALIFSKPVFLQIMSKMLGEEITTVNPEVETGAGELLNIIFGNAKTDLSRKGFILEQALPCVIHAAELKLSLTSQPTLSVIPFNCEFGSFHLLMGLQYKTDAGSAK